MCAFGYGHDWRAYPPGLSTPSEGGRDGGRKEEERGGLVLPVREAGTVGGRRKRGKERKMEGRRGRN